MTAEGSPPAVRYRDRVPSDCAPEAFNSVPSVLDRYIYTPDSQYVVFVMVGLPARGKSFIALRLARYCEWVGIPTRIFNVGNHRRNTETSIQDSKYFDPDNPGAVSRRDELAFEVIDSLVVWLMGRTDELVVHDSSPTKRRHIDVPASRFAIFDATNTTKARRQKVAERLSRHKEVGVIFLESICDDPAILEANFQQKLSKSPDYTAKNTELARKDLMERVSHYEKVYERLDEETMQVGDRAVRISYISLLNLSSHVVAHNIYGRSASAVLPYLMSLHVGTRPVWLVRMPHGERSAGAWRRGSSWPPPNEIQFADQPLSERGRAFAGRLAQRVAEAAPAGAVAFCGTYTRALETVERLGVVRRVRASLNPMDRGSAGGLSLSQIQRDYPQVWDDPVHIRFPGGESISDLLLRLMPTLIEVEQEMRAVLIVAPLSVLQVLYCYYAKRPTNESLTVNIPLHSAVEVRPDGGNFSLRVVVEG